MSNASDERQHCEAVAREWCGCGEYGVNSLADLIQRERAGLLARAEAAERDRSDIIRMADNLRAKLAEAEAERTRAQEERDAVMTMLAGSRVLLAKAEARVAESERDNDRLRQDRADALSVTSRDGLLSSEWVARTGKAERERDKADAAAGRMREALESTLGWLRWSDGACAVCEHMHCDCGADDVRENMRAALATDAGKGWVSPEAHAEVLAQLDAMVDARAEAIENDAYMSPEQVTQACAAARVAALEEAAGTISFSAAHANIEYMDDRTLRREGFRDGLIHAEDRIRTLKVTR